MVDTATILICDDEAHLRELMRISLEPDYAFAEAATGAEAIESIDRIEPDLVLLDVMMPGTNGLAVIEHVRANPQVAATPVLVVSAFASERDRLAAFGAGATAFLRKPFDPEELRALVEDLLGPRS